MQTIAPAAYRLEWKPGDYNYYSPESFVLEVKKEGARIHGLYTFPQAGCSNTPTVFCGWHWVEPKNTPSGECPAGFVPMYLGPIIHEPKMDEDVLFAFPLLVEPTYKRMYCTGTMYRCKSCVHDEAWHTLKQLPSALRLCKQKNMTRVDDDICRANGGGYYNPKLY